jgi:radical SAM protein with 4Fe4S-binding SPASM domain
MMPVDLSAGLCRKFSPEELDKTFNFSATTFRTAPKGDAYKAWEEAKEVCIECPVFLICREQCWGQEYGVVGGTDEHERYLYRRQMTAQLARKDADERAQLAAYFHARHAGGLGDTAGSMARSTGYSKSSVEALLAEHQAVLDAESRRRDAARTAPKGADWAESPVFPAGSPTKGDGWAWYFGRAHKGHYVAETADGAYVRMKVKSSTSQTVKWLPASHVDLRTAVIPVIQTWVGRPDESAAA